MQQICRSVSQSRVAAAVLCVVAGLGCQDSLRGADDDDHHDHDHDHDHDQDAGLSVDADVPVFGDAGSDYEWELPEGFPVPPVPEDNPMTEAKVELGRHLFYDVRLSQNETQSCASCHRQELAFTDGQPRGIGSTGEEHPRGAMSLANVAYASTLTWGNPLMTELERQSQLPLFGDDPIELGLRSQGDLEERLSEIADYRGLFVEAFPDVEQPITANNVTKALAAFQRTLISGHSPFDEWLYGGDESAVTEAAKRGYELFHSERLECFHCHAGFNLTDHVHFAGKPFFERPYHNNGLYNLDGDGAYPDENTGIHDVTRRDNDMGRFKAPTLRNIALTAPYMHDGSIETLDEVIDHYAAGGRTITEGPYQGDGSQSPLRSNLIRGFEISDRERGDVIEFLESLTDSDFLSDPRFSDPWMDR